MHSNFPHILCTAPPVLNCSSIAPAFLKVCTWTSYGIGPILQAACPFTTNIIVMHHSMLLLLLLLLSVLVFSIRWLLH